MRERGSIALMALEALDDANHAAVINSSVRGSGMPPAPLARETWQLAKLWAASATEEERRAFAFAAWKSFNEFGKTGLRGSRKRGGPRMNQFSPYGEDWRSEMEPDDAFQEPSATPPVAFRSTVWQWRDPATIPPRPWVYGLHMLRKQVSVTVAPGGVGKSSHSIVEALSMVTGRKLLGEWSEPDLNVWIFNLEDDAEEARPPHLRRHAALQRPPRRGSERACGWTAGAAHPSARPSAGRRAPSSLARSWPPSRRS